MHLPIMTELYYVVEEILCPIMTEFLHAEEVSHYPMSEYLEQLVAIVDLLDLGTYCH